MRSSILSPRELSVWLQGIVVQAALRISVGAYSAASLAPVHGIVSKDQGLIGRSQLFPADFLCHVRGSLAEPIQLAWHEQDYRAAGQGGSHALRDIPASDRQWVHVS